MEETLIRKAEINLVVDKLDKIVEKRKDSIELANVHIKYLEDAVNDINKILSVAKSLKINEENDINTLEKTIRSLRRLETIDSNKNSDYKNVILYAEGQSVIDTYEHGDLKSIIEQINKDLIKFLEKANKLVKDEAIVNKEEEPKPIEEVKKVNLIDVAKNSEEEGIKIRINDNFGILSNELHGKNEEEYLFELILAEKMCEQCKIFSQDTLILSCRCAICINCLKGKVFKDNNKIFENNYEACQSKHSSMCSCPTHGCPIDIKILEQIFDEDIIEKASIDAMKRQLKSSVVSKKYYPSMCANCKELIQDETNSTISKAICTKHAVCINCYK